MSLASVNGLAVDRLRLEWPEAGAWRADVRLPGGEALAGRVAIEIAGVRFDGEAGAGGESFGASTYRISPVPGLAKLATARPYSRASAGLMVRALITEAGATPAAVESGPVWRTWDQRRAPIGAALRAISLACAARGSPMFWRTLRDGRIAFGARRPATDAPDMILERYDRSTGVVLAAEEAPTVEPGMVLDGSRIVRIVWIVSGSFRTEVHLER